MSSHLYQSPSSSSTYQTSLNDRAGNFHYNLNSPPLLVSPTRSKITQLSEKLSNLQLQVDDEKSVITHPILIPLAQKRSLREQTQNIG